MLLGEAGFWRLIRTEMMKTLRGFFYGLMGITLLDQRPVADTPASCTELPGGLVVTASLERFGPGVATLCGFDRDRLIQYRVDAAEGVEDSAARNRPRWVTRDTQFGISGNRVLQFDVRLTRRNLVSKRAIKAYRPEAAEEVPGGGAEAALAIAEVVERDAVMEETGGVVWVDESEYQVTLRRLDGAPAQVWQGTAQGMPRLWTLGTLALVMDGKRVTALNANNEKLWETRLSYPPLAAAPGDRDGAEIPPCIEASGVVYVWDAGSLAALDAASGTVRWRVAAVGIREVYRDGRGKLFVTATNATPEKLLYPLEGSVGAPPDPVILCVAEAGGKVLWRQERNYDRQFMGGGHLYAVRTRIDPEAVVASVFERRAPVENFNLMRLNPSRGAPRWMIHALGEPDAIDAQAGRVALATAEGIRLFGFFDIRRPDLADLKRAVVPRSTTVRLGAAGPGSVR